MRHWFGLTADDLDDLPAGELAEFEQRLAGLPPIGGFVQYQLKD